MLNDPRPGKKLLVLDIDYTLFDHRSAAESGIELMRPYLHDFLESAYEVSCFVFNNVLIVNFKFINHY